LRSLRHLGKGAENFLLGEIDVLEGVVKEILELLGFFGHCLTPLRNPALQRCTLLAAFGERRHPLGSKTPNAIGPRLTEPADDHSDDAGGHRQSRLPAERPQPAQSIE
jgi:hypothetical protein